ncbi:hypothetical protein [Streptomyces sp. Wb2n-11]|uniref:hypothetical protein n=1 Tax=Streptomyces sp. Wb2n-11 TaxID=1030533 RepID=UPI000AF89072|nr:hypothetical protein [Streptomyces sp. Wb2n-11]
MNSTEHTGTQVLVEVTGSSKEDANAVFGALCTAFTSDRPSDDAPRDDTGGRPMVWSATYDVSAVREQAAPARLTESVSVTLQGGYRAVDQLREQLESAFSVSEEGSASGDQEKELQLRLESGPGTAP